MRVIALLTTLLLTSLSAQADWTLSNDNSNLTFLTTKNSQVTEVSHFKSLSGTFDGKLATLEIDLTSVDSLIPIRNERMAKFLFETTKFAKAVISVSIDDKLMEELEKTSSIAAELEAKVSLHGKEKTVPAKVFVSKESNGTLNVLSTQPILIYASDFLLSDGVNKLQEIAKLKSISHTVPVSFQLQYKK